MTSLRTIDIYINYVRKGVFLLKKLQLLLLLFTVIFVMIGCNTNNTSQNEQTDKNVKVEQSSYQ